MHEFGTVELLADELTAKASRCISYEFFAVLLGNVEEFVEDRFGCSNEGFILQTFVDSIELGESLVDEQSEVAFEEWILTGGTTVNLSAVFVADAGSDYVGGVVTSAFNTRPENALWAICFESSFTEVEERVSFIGLRASLRRTRREACEREGANVTGSGSAMHGTVGAVDLQSRSSRLRDGGVDGNWLVGEETEVAVVDGKSEREIDDRWVFSVIVTNLTEPDWVVVFRFVFDKSGRDRLDDVDMNLLFLWSAERRLILRGEFVANRFNKIMELPSRVLLDTTDDEQDAFGDRVSLLPRDVVEDRWLLLAEVLQVFGDFSTSVILGGTVVGAAENSGSRLKAERVEIVEASVLLESIDASVAEKRGNNSSGVDVAEVALVVVGGARTTGNRAARVSFRSATNPSVEGLGGRRTGSD